MPFIYSAARKKVRLTLSPDDVGVYFDTPGVGVRAVQALRSGEGSFHEQTPRGFGRIMLLSAARAARDADATLRSALSRRHMRSVKRTLPVYVEKESGLRAVATGEITVRFKPKVTARQRDKVLRSLHLALLRPNEFNPRQYVVAPAAEADELRTVDLANALCECDDVVEYAAPNLVSEHRKAAVPKDRLLSRQWHLNNRGGNGAVAGEDVDALLAWEVTPGGSPDVVIAIVDDGVDIHHPDLQANIWVNPDPNAPDRNGRNFYDNTYDPRPRYFHPPYDQLEGNDSHGTPCAGVAAAVGNNRRGVAGIAYRCKILPVKIFGADDLASNDRVANAIRYAGRHAQVISCSWSSPWNPDLESAINDVVQTGRGGRGCLVFCATGNDYRASIAFPARHPQTLAVGASDDQGKRSQYSNYGRGIDFVAPSSDPDRNRTGITTTDISLRNRGFNLRGAYTYDFGGTSSATPLAAGITALVLSLNPSLTWREVRSILRSTAEKVDQQSGNYQNGYSLQYGYGRLNAHQAVLRAQAHAARRRRR